MKINKKILTVVLTGVFALTFTTSAFASNYEVKSGDTITKIAEKHGVTAESIKSANNMANDKLKVGQHLYIPDGGHRYTVKKGDTLSKIAYDYNTTVANIKRANKMQSDTLEVGQVLWISMNDQKKTPSRSMSNKGMKVSQTEIDLMAKAVYGEARGESYAGQVAVAAVILNRVQSDEFPNTVKDVVYQPWAFTAVHDGQIDLKPNQTAYKAVREALTGNDPTYESIYYWNPKTATSEWIWSRAVVTKIGNHVFGY